MHLDALPSDTRALYLRATTAEQLQPFTLVGGTALALQLGHRQSLDLDFAWFEEQLPGHSIDAWIDLLRESGTEARDITDPQHASQFRINTGMSLALFARDYEIAGVKVTFFVMGRNAAQRRFYQAADTFQQGPHSFAILGVEGLKISKVLVLAERIRSRDLFDLMILMRDYGLTIEEIVEIVTTLGQNNDPEHYLAALCGDLPLDAADEGLKPTGSMTSVHQLYAFFLERIDAWQVSRAAG